jgi:hypothetical protein
MDSVTMKDLQEALGSIVNEIDENNSHTVSYTYDGTSTSPSIYTGGSWKGPGYGGAGAVSTGVHTGDSVTLKWPETTKPACDHVMGDETELEDGQVVGFCVSCGDKIKGRRMVGGYGLARLKDVLVDALGDPAAMADLLDEIDRVELMLHVEEQALRSAYDMIEMARKMVKTIVTPEES